MNKGCQESSPKKQVHRTGKEEKEMKELNLNEMNMVNGAGAVHMTAKKKIWRKIGKWISGWFN